MTRPVYSIPADLELVSNPIPQSWILEGKPQAKSARIAQSADRTSLVVAWSCTPGRFNWHYTVDETLYILAGEVAITDEEGQTRRVTAGDVVFFPAGCRAEWQVLEEVRKIAVCRQSMPLPLGLALRAWNKAVRRLTGASAGADLGAENAAGAEQPGPAALHAMGGIIDNMAAHP